MGKAVKLMPHGVLRHDQLEVYSERATKFSTLIGS